MENLGELAKTFTALLNVVQNVSALASLKSLVDRINPMLKVLGDEPDTELFSKWAGVMAQGMHGLLEDEKEMDCLEKFVTSIKESMDREILEINDIPEELTSEQVNANVMKALVWLPNQKSTGHFAFDLCAGGSTDYCSFWPKASKSQYLFGVHGCKMSSYDRDVEAEKGHPRVFKLYTLDKMKMIAKLEEFKSLMASGVIKYKALTPLSWNEDQIYAKEGDKQIITHNCCTIIWSLLVEGGIKNLINETIFVACVNINVISGLGNLIGLSSSSSQKMSMTANPWSMFNILTMATHAERIHFSGLLRLIANDDEDSDSTE